VRLFAGQALVIVAGAASLALVALAIAPGIYHDHIRDALGVVPADVTRHLDEAFQDSMAIALGVAVLAATITALAVSWVISVRLARPIRDLAVAAEDVTHGHLDRRVAVAGAEELRQLAAAFNTMAAALAESEQRRHALFSDVSHELRTPLTTIDAYLEGLADGVVASEPVTWELLRNQTRRLGRLVEDLNTLARADEHRLDLRRRPVDIASVTDVAAAAVQRAFDEKGVTLEYTQPPDDVILNADPDRIGEVLANVLGNALRHTPPSGRVRLAAAANSQTVTITVTDTGEGVPEGELDRIFDRFHRADASRARTTGGSGLGLAISRALVNAHGGAIHAAPGPAGQGLAVVIALPRATASS
jgi:signal transduction histidine kinase